MSKKALFLDRDGVINKAFIRAGKSYPPSSLEEVSILEGVPEALQLSKKLGFINIVITNQPDIGTGKTTLENVEHINTFLKKELLIDDIYMCPHTDGNQCLCRKPNPGLFIEAQKKWNIDLEESFLIGDRWKDIEAGQRVGCKCFFLDYDYREKKPAPPYTSIASLLDAVHIIQKAL